MAIYEANLRLYALRYRSFCFSQPRAANVREEKTTIPQKAGYDGRLQRVHQTPYGIQPLGQNVHKTCCKA